MTAEGIDALFARTLAGADLDDEGAWEAVHTLGVTGSREGFERSAAWCAARRKDFASESFPLSAEMARIERTLGRFIPRSSPPAPLAESRQQQEGGPIGSRPISRCASSSGIRP